MCVKARLIVFCVAFLLLAFSCSEGGSYVVDSTESTRVVAVLDHWAAKNGFSKIACADYYRPGIEGSCHELAESEPVTRSFIAAEKIEKVDNIRVWMSFTGFTESQRAEKLDTLGAALSSEFGPDGVSREE